MSGAAPAWAAVGPAGRFCAAAVAVAVAADADAVAADAADGLASADSPPACAGTPAHTGILYNITLLQALLRIRSWIRIRMYLGLPDPDPLVRGTDPALDPSIIKQNRKENLDSNCFVTSL